MPNNRNKNRNRNKNKQRNKQQQQQQQQGQKQEEIKKYPKEASATAPTDNNGHKKHSLSPSTTPATTLLSRDSNVAHLSTTTNIIGLNDACTNVQTLNKVLDVTTTAPTGTETDTETAAVEETNDTVLNDSSQCDNKIKNNYGVNTNDSMGNEKSKIVDDQRSFSMVQSVNKNSTITKPTVSTNTCYLGKVIVHRIVCEDSNSVTTGAAKSTVNDLKTQDIPIAAARESSRNALVQQESLNTKNSEDEKSFKIIIHKILAEEDIAKKEEVDRLTNDDEKKQIYTTIATNDVTQESQHRKDVEEKEHAIVIQNGVQNDLINDQNSRQKAIKIIVHKVTTEDEDIKRSEPDGNSLESLESHTIQPHSHATQPHSHEHEAKVIVHKVNTSDNVTKASAYYSEQPFKHQSKVIVHQVQLEDPEDQPKITSPTMKEPIAAAAKPTTSEVKIIEISDESLSDLEELRSPVISEAESSIDYCESAQNVVESITEVLSSSSSSNGSPTSGKQPESRKQKRIALEHHFLPQMLNPRFLDSISEENSELSDNYENPLSRSVSIESATNCLTEGKAQKLNAKYPKSSLDFSKPHKQQSSHNRKSKVIREEPIAVAVSAHLQDVPDADESCSTVSSRMSPETETAEVVYINSASSSMSDLHDIELLDNLQTRTSEIDFDDTDFSDIVNKSVVENICSESVTSSASSSLAFTANIRQQKVNQSYNNSNSNSNNNININSHDNNKNIQTNNNCNNTINNSCNTDQTQNISPSSTAATAQTRSLAETKTNLHANSKLESIFSSTASTSSESPANEKLVFAQIEEQISSLLSSINEVASQNTTTTIETKASPSTSSSSSSSSSSKAYKNLSSTQHFPVTTTPTTDAIRTLEYSCEESANTNSSSISCSDANNNAKTERVILQNVNMNTVRDLINNNKNNAYDLSVKLNDNNENSAISGNTKLNYRNKTHNPISPPKGSPPPPPIPPPPQQVHDYDECDNTLAFSYPSNSSSSPALPLLQKHVAYHNSYTQPQHDNFKDINCALNLLTSSVTRQESLDSHCSDSTNFSQCTAINVAPEGNSDSVQPSPISDLKTNTALGYQQSPNNRSSSSSADPKKLRLLCTETLASFPYGGAVLEELAAIAQNIEEARTVKTVHFEKDMPYPLPELPHIDDLQLSLKVEKSPSERAKPAQQDQSWLGVPTTNDPKVLVCLSPSQRSFIQLKPEHKPDDLLDAHQKFVDRRGYHEYTKEQLMTLEKEKLAEQQLLQTAAMMKKLRKSITPPPPQIPPPPVPVKSSETANKAQHLTRKTVTAKTTTTTTHNENRNAHDKIHLTKNNEQIPEAPNGESNGEENKHRLLSIIQDTSESNANKNNSHSVSHCSSLPYEKSSRQTTNVAINSPVQKQVSIEASALNNDTPDSLYQFPHLSEHKGSENMQSVETTLGQMFPTLGYSNIFDQQQKRFSNIESLNTEPFCSQIMCTQPKRYSSVETHSYETQKRTENGKVVEDFSTSQHESKTTGNKPDEVISFPLKLSMPQESNSFLHSGKKQNIHNLKAKQHKNDEEIMSALNLNTHSSHAERKQQTATQSETIINTTTTKTSQNIVNDKNKSAKIDDKDLTKQLEPENTTIKREEQDIYKEFRHRAKAVADKASTLPSFNAAAVEETTAKVTSNGYNNGEMIFLPTTITQHKKPKMFFDHENLFKEFDDLSKQLHKELETTKAEREQREISASMFDLNTMHMRQKQQIEEFNKTRQEHLKELQQEIERSMKSRSLKFKIPQETPYDVIDHHIGRTYEIPIHIENGDNKKSATNPSTTRPNTYEEAPPVPAPPKIYQIPIQLENSNSTYMDEPDFRRAESMFDLSDDMHHRQRSYSNHMEYKKTEDDWSKYAGDFGYSENITRPFAKEVEICYQRRPDGIRAPRLSASTNDLSFNKPVLTDVRRHHAPMLNRAPEQSRPKFGSCYSMIERDPYPKYISTTTRRGVSPAPQNSTYFPLDNCHVREEDLSQRRASLPREIHEQQLKYITNKEEELRTEFERLQNERRRLMEEAQSSPPSIVTPTSPIMRTLRDQHYRSTHKLPTLTEDEVFRQQMAEEWLNKVAERENRRLQNIIKISKIHEDAATTKHQGNMEEEFLSRVKERRHKLAMPADSDWESGAESQPTIRTHLSEAEDVPPIKIIEGEKEANLRRLPRHLREFAKFSNHQKENIEGGHREEHQEEERSEEITDNSVSRALKKSTVLKTVKTLRAPMLPENGGHDTKLHFHKARAIQTLSRPCDPHITDRSRRRANKQTRFAVTTNRRSWSESDLLQEIDKDLKLAKGFLFQDVYNVKHEYLSEPETEYRRPKNMAQLDRRQYDGIGPMTNDGMPIILRSEVKEPHQHEWYKRLYQTIHKQKHGGRFQYSKANGYQSEPERNYDSDYSTIKYRTVNPNRFQSVSSNLNVRRSNETLYGSLPNPVKSVQNSYKNQPGRIENYVTGHSSVSDKEKKEWWDEIMDIFNVQLDREKLSSHYTEGNLSRALAKESGYTSDSNLVFRRKEIPQSSPLSPVEQKQAYKSVQAGGEPPLFGFRKPAPDKSKVSPNRYYESDVNIHFKTPVRQEFKYSLSEEELAIRQAEQIQKLYQEERRRKYLQELQDMNSRRHTDNFTPSQKSPIALNRYDDFPADLAPKPINQVKSVARALFNFQAQNSKELSFKKGDIIYIKRAIDKNWYEGEHNAMIGLFPANYVEIINKETVYPAQPQNNAYRKPSEGQARAKYNFQAQSGVELSLNKGELVALTRRVDDNWFEGRIANRKGIFPVSYVEVLTDIGAEDIAARTTTIHQTTVVNVRPSLDAMRTNINNEFNTVTRNGNQPPHAILRETRNGHKTDILHVDTNSDPLIYRALYKYRPQNSDELELQEGDIVHVLEKCDDGWYVGTSQRTGCFGTFPGNYVEGA